MRANSTTLTTGLAMFSMFFGAGNVVFPLAIGQYAKNLTPYAISGLLLTAVGVPFLGLLAMTLFNGDYRQFFARIGKIPGFLIALLIMALIGPFGAMPRVIALSYSTLVAFGFKVSLSFYSLIATLIILALTFRRSRLLEILGKYLTPILLASLCTLIIKGLTAPTSLMTLEASPRDVFLLGITEGYNMMDLLAAFFFSPVVILCLVKETKVESQSAVKNLIRLTLRASCIGASLLAFVYIAFGLLAAHTSGDLMGVPQAELVGQIAKLHLGPYAGIIAVVAVSLACLTTAMAVATVFAEFIHEDIAQKAISFQTCLIGTLIVSYFISTLDFSGIMRFLIPILQLSYPALIVLTLSNLLYKLWSFPYVKTPVALTFIISSVNYFTS